MEDGIPAHSPHLVIKLYLLLLILLLLLVTLLLLLVTLLLWWPLGWQLLCWWLDHLRGPLGLVSQLRRGRPFPPIPVSCRALTIVEEAPHDGGLGHGGHALLWGADHP
jgi:hypothetical protein